MQEIRPFREDQNHLREEEAAYTGFAHKSEEEKLRESIFCTPMEKLHLFTQMLRRQSVLKKAKTIKP